jgi:hypothetical protein
MLKTCAILGPVALIIILITSLLNSLCCVLSPMAAICLGLGAGFLAGNLESPQRLERAVVRGSYAGAIIGVVALLAQTIGQSISPYLLQLAGPRQACFSVFCNIASTPMDQTAVLLDELFSACFCGLILLALQAGLGGVGGAIWFRTLGRKAEATPTVTSMGATPPEAG